jgi:hypothetical protein
VNNFKFGLLAIALSASFAAAADTNATSTGQATAIAQTAPIVIQTGANPNGAGTAANPLVERTEVTQRGGLKTTGQAFLPGMAVASGSFNCGATGGVAVGAMGGAISIGGAKSLSDCVAMNLMNFAAIAKDDELYVALLCGMDAGKAAMESLRRPCPNGSTQQISSAPESVRKAVAVQEAPKPQLVQGTADQRNQMAGMRDEEKLRWIGADLKDPYIARRAPNKN